MNIGETIVLSIGLAMDAGCVGMADGMNDKTMNYKKILLIAFMFGLFQGVMPLIGYFAGSAFQSFIAAFIPWFALLLLGFLGVKMIIEGVRKKEEDEVVKPLNNKTLLVQAVATSIDALTVGVLFVEMSVDLAILSCGIIALVTFIIVIAAIIIGKKFGTIFKNKAAIFGGIILIAIGLKIFIEHFI